VPSSALPLLLLAPRIPFPPTKGDKIRSHHLLRRLASRYQVHLGAFVDDPADWSHRAEVDDLCESSCIMPLDRRWASIRSMAALADGRPLTLAYFADRRMQRWVDGVIVGRGIERIIVYCSSMAPYVDHRRFEALRRIIDFVDVDSEKWRLYAARASLPWRTIWDREARTLLAYERDIAARFDSAWFVTPEEADLFRRLAPESAPRVDHYENGVDVPAEEAVRNFANPYPRGGAVVVFSGAMDYAPNVDAALWFADEILPSVRQQVPEARFSIVGARPARSLERLSRLPGIFVTGAVADVRPYLRHAAVAVAPLRIARGIQNKVLEAWAMECPVVMTGAAAEGLRQADWIRECVHDEPAAFARAVARQLVAPVRFNAAREYLRKHYSWPENLQRFAASIDP